MEKIVLETLQSIDILKEAGIDKILGRFLNDGVNVLAIPIAEICNTSIFFRALTKLVRNCEIKTVIQKVYKIEIKNFRPIYLLLLISSVTERTVFNQVENFLHQMRFCTIIHQDLQKTIRSTSASFFLTEKY